VSGSNPAELLVRRILEGTAPAQAKKAAARGILPIPRSELVRVLVFLSSDPDASIRKESFASLSGLEPEAIRDVLGEEEVTPDVLTYFSRVAVLEKSSDIAEKIAFHSKVPDEALEILAAGGTDEIIHLVLTNEERLAGKPALIELLLANKAIRPDQKSRLVELRSRLERYAEKQEETPAPDDPGTVVAEEEEEELTIEEVAKILEVDVGELMTASEIAGGDEFEQEDVPDEIRGAYQRIMTLNTSQKAILAMKGGREERSILIRDTNRLVALAVMKNPRLPEGEVESISAMRNVHEAVLRYIGANREWTKNYNIAAALVRNPRTPPGISTNFISRLNNRDLKFLSKDKNVPELIRRMSKKTLDQRAQKSRVSFKRH